MAAGARVSAVFDLTHYYLTESLDDPVTTIGIVVLTPLKQCFSIYPRSNNYGLLLCNSLLAVTL
jgi:hypothetical protein